MTIFRLALGIAVAVLLTSAGLRLFPHAGSAQVANPENPDWGREVAVDELDMPTFSAPLLFARPDALVEPSALPSAQALPPAIGTTPVPELTGIVMQGGQARAWLALGDEPARPFRLDEIIGSWTIIAIGQTAVELRGADGSPLTIRLYSE